MDKLYKILIEWISTITLTRVFNAHFWQELIITIIIILANTIIFPYVKKLIDRSKANKYQKEQMKKLIDEVNKEFIEFIQKEDENVDKKE